LFPHSYCLLIAKQGAFHHSDFVGKQFGSKIYSRSSSGWIYCLKPTPELWSLALHTRTQIVDEVDAAVVTFKLGVRPGCVVVESGTGSGSMSQSLMRATYPSGHLYTFEYNQARADQAREEFRRYTIVYVYMYVYVYICVCICIYSSSKSSSISINILMTKIHCLYTWRRKVSVLCTVRDQICNNLFLKGIYMYMYVYVCMYVLRIYVYIVVVRVVLVLLSS
jgi:hypothetical protein